MPLKTVLPSGNDSGWRIFIERTVTTAASQLRKEKFLGNNQACLRASPGECKKRATWHEIIVAAGDIVSVEPSA
jgi:hypothetical protein